MPDAGRDLVDKASRGDAVAVDALLERHLPALHAFVRLHAEGDAIVARESRSDLVQSVGAAPRVRAACLSNTGPYHWELMNGRTPNYLPLAVLDFRFTSFSIGALKPHARVYAHVEQHTGVRPEAILFFDDDTENCRAASERGWTVEQINSTGDTAAQMRACLEELGVL